MESKLKILFVEDVKSDAELIFHEIEKNKIPFSKAVVDNKRDYLEKLKDCEPDLIISDYSLPQFDGMAALLLRNEICPLTPFLLVTGSINEIVAVECMKAGADDYILKDNLSRLGSAIINSVKKASLAKEKISAEEKLRKSESRLQKAQTIAHIGNWELDLSTKIIWSSEESMKIYGIYDKSQNFQLSRVQKIVLPEYRGILDEALDRLLKYNEPYEVEFSIKRENDGAVRSVFSKAELVLEGDGSKVKVVGVIQDITERKSGEKALLFNNLLLHTQQEASLDSILVVNEDDKIVNFNNNFIDFAGISREIIEKGFDIPVRQYVADQIVDPEEFIEKIKHLNKFHEETSHDELVFKDGRIYDRYSAPMFGPDKKYYGRVWYFRDITESKLAEESLRRSEEKYRHIFENVQDVYYETSIDGTILNLSPSISLISKGQYNQADLMGKSMYDFYSDPEERNLIVSALKETGSVPDFEITLKNRDSSSIPCSISAKILFNAKEQPEKIIGSMRDITNRKLTEELLRESEEKFRSIMENSADAIFMTDKQGKYTYANKEVTRLLGFTSEEMKSKTILDLTPKNEADKYLKIFMEVLNEGKVFTEIELLKKDGNFISTDLNSVLLPGGQIYGSCRDITERKNGEEALRYSLEFSDSLLKTIPFGMDIVDEDGKVLFLSDSFTRLFGKEAVGKKCWNLYRDDQIQCSDCPLIKGITIGETESYESHGVLGNRIFEISHTGMIYKGKKAMLEIFQDITERKESEEELIRAKEKAEESDRLKTAFLHNISHEIRTPMNAIVGFSALLGEPDADLQSRKSYIDVIMQSSNHLLSIITDIVDISNLEANLTKIVKSETDVNSTIKSLINQFLPKANEKKVKLEWETVMPDSEAMILTDRTKLTQVLSNLLSNALKFTDKGTIKLSFRHKDDFLEFSVADSGIGIAPAHHAKIFDRFYQVQSSVSRLYEGTGLGLAISKGYIELLGGKIWLTSEPGKGTTFFFTIPYEKVIAHEKPASEIKSPDSVAFSQKRKILVAEDVESNFKLIKYFLSGSNTEVIHAINGKEAVDLFLAGTNIDLILMDIKMPVMDGYTAVSLIREKNTDIPIIAQTAYADDRNKAMECGCSGFISKPFDKKGLMKILCEFI